MFLADLPALCVFMCVWRELMITGLDLKQMVFDLSVVYTVGCHSYCTDQGEAAVYRSSNVQICLELLHLLFIHSVLLKGAYN